MTQIGWSGHGMAADTWGGEEWEKMRLCAMLNQFGSDCWSTHGSMGSEKCVKEYKPVGSGGSFFPKIMKMIKRSSGSTFR